MNRKIWTILLSTVLIFTLLTGCGKSDENAAEDTRKPSPDVTSSVSNYDVDNMSFDNVKIKIAGRYTEGGDAESDYYISKVNEFNNMNNGITVEMINITDEADYLNRLSTDFASGDAPNIFMEYGGSRCLDYVKSGSVLDLTPYLNQYPDWKSGFKTTNWDPCQFEKYGYSGTYGVPWGAYQLLLYYNKPMLEKYSIQAPVTFEELLSACATLVENGEKPFIVGEKDIYKFEHLHTALSLKTYGADIADQLASREVAYDSDKMLDIYAQIKDMVDKGYLGDSLLNATAPEEREYFGQGMCAFMYDTSRAAAVLQDTELLKSQGIGVVKFPYVDEQYKNVEMGGASSAYYISTINASDEQIAASVKFLKYITNTDYTNGLISVYPNTYSVNTTVQSDNYLYNDIVNAMSSTEVYKTDLQNYDSASYMTTAVRNALQLLAMDKAPEDVGKQIIDTIKDNE